MKWDRNLLFVIMISLVIYWARVTPHAANWSPVLGLCLFSGWVSGGKWYGFLLPLLALFMSDLSLMEDPAWMFNYVAWVGLIGVGVFMKPKFKSFLGHGLFGAMVFFLISNFGVWFFSGLYSQDFQGLMTCFTLAVPFFRTTLMSALATMMGLFVFVEGYEYLMNSGLLGKVKLEKIKS
ncbi:MAG: DUF6580 family putative transport protein [Pseudomonadota bacterium]